jgi:regulator of replication initiation timing
MDDPEDLEKKLNEALNECARLKAENDRLRRLIGRIPENPLAGTPRNAGLYQIWGLPTQKGEATLIFIYHG